MIFCLIIARVLDAQVIEYQLHKNYGQILKDYSSYGFHGINGVRIDPDPQDYTQTNKGAYLTNYSIVSIASEPVSNKIIYPYTYSLIFWINSIDEISSASLFCKSSKNRSMNIIQDKINRKAFIYIKSMSSVQKIESQVDSFLTGTWLLLVLEVENEELSLYINNYLAIKATTQDSIEDSETLGDHFIGACRNSLEKSKDDKIYGFNGFVFYFAMIDKISVKHRFLAEGSNKCIVGIYDYCSPSFQLPDYLEGCGSRIFDSVHDSDEKICLHGKIFKSNKIPDCSCPQDSCEIQSNDLVICLNYSKPTHIEQSIESPGQNSSNHKISRVILESPAGDTRLQSSPLLQSESTPDSISYTGNSEDSYCVKGEYLNSDSETCIKCSPICYTCSKADLCSVCADQNLDPSECIPCHFSCLTCEGKTFYQCKTCINNLLEYICVDYCPLGFISIEKICVQQSVYCPALKYEFEGVGEVYFDLFQNISAVKVMNETRARQLSQPFSVYNRGVFMSGESYLMVDKNETRVFANDFSFSIWLKPYDDDGVIFERYDLVSLSLMKLHFNETMVLLNIKLGDAVILFNCEEVLNLEKWNHLHFNHEFGSGNNVEFWINGEKITLLTVDSVPYVDSSSGILTIGSDFTFQNSFRGFLYNFQIFNSLILPSFFVSTESCINCNPCLPDLSCLDKCEPSQYELNSVCEDCDSSCSLTCKNSTTCSLCDDPFCLYCSDYSASSCYSCLDNYELKEGRCFPCNDSSYFDYKSRYCILCPPPCLTCDSRTYCTKCQENSTFSKEKICECNQGFYLDTYCQLSVFKATLTMSQDLQATIWFSSNLQEKLKSSQVKVSLDEVKVKFKLENIDLDRVWVTFEFKNLKKSMKLKVEFSDDVVDKNGAKLVLKQVEVKFIVADRFITKDEDLKEGEDVGGVGEKAAIYGLFATVGFSMLQGDFRSLFDFVNTAEIFYAVYLMDLGLHIILEEFLLSIRIPKKFPRLSKYFFDDRYGTSIDSKSKSFGYKSSMFILNTEAYIETLLISIGILLIVSLLALIKIIRPRLAIIVSHFKYSVFLRFWIQSFLEFIICLRLGFKFMNFESFSGNFNFGVCLLITVIFKKVIDIGMILFYLYLIRKRREILDFEEIKNFETNLARFLLILKKIATKVCFIMGLLF